MTTTIRASDDRGRFDFGWLDTRHTFSFGEYADPEHVRFRSLRVINEDVVAPGRGFDLHEHRDMEIITYILSGALQHRDSLGHTETIRPGDAQRMSAGRGIAHSEFNASASEPVHLLQIWILPDHKGHEPGYEQKHFPLEQRRNRLRLLASPDGADGSVTIHQDARLYSALLEPGRTARLELKPGRAAWVQVARGALSVNGQRLEAGDGAAVEREPALELAAESDTEALVFDLA
jgi:quercetin 2,3-dioxygenase